MLWLICTGRLKAQGNPKAVDNCERPRCFACEFGNIHLLTNKAETIKQNPMKYKELKKDHIMPGHMVSSDNYISRALGRI